MENQTGQVETSKDSVAVSNKVNRPQWRKPTYAILDVERGTVTTTGPVADGNGSTS